MNRQQFSVLVVVLVMCAAVAWHFYQRGNSSWQSADQSIGFKLLPNLPVNDVAQIDIQSRTQHLTLARTNDVWIVRQRGNYPADFSQISDLLRKLADVEVVQHQETPEAELPRFNLSRTGSDSGTLLELKDQNDKSVASVQLGKDHMNQPANGQGWPDGRYVLLVSKAVDVGVISETFDNVTPDPATWLDKTFVKISNPKSIAVTFPAATNSWELTRASATNDWKLADARPGEKLDSSKVDDITGAFDSLSFNDVSPGTTAPKNADTLTVDTFDGTNYEAKIWTSGDDNDSLTISIDTTNGKPAAENQFGNWTYQISNYSLESLLKSRTNLIESATAPKGS